MPICTCTICGDTFTPASRSSRGKLCGKSECRTAFYSSLGKKGNAALNAKTPRAPIVPVERPYRTILQPVMSAYLASLAKRQ